MTRWMKAWLGLSLGIMVACTGALPATVKAQDAPASAKENTSAQYAARKPLPRRLIALYDTIHEPPLRFNPIHRFIEMPANHLGFDIRYYDVNHPLPEFDDQTQGIVIWFTLGIEIKDPDTLLNWLEKGLRSGRKVIIMGNLGMPAKYRDSESGHARLNEVLALLGVQDRNLWVPMTYTSHILQQNPEITGFERNYSGVFPGYMRMEKLGTKSVSHLTLQREENPDDPSELVVTNPAGGFVAPGYAIFFAFKGEISRVQQWYINPFNFLRMALGAENYPKPDTTTLDGRRIFYSHIDGDGWNNVSEVEKYHKYKIISAEVIRREVVEAYPDFAFTVGLIASDLDPKCQGVSQSVPVARAIMGMPNVWPSSHTWSHPLYWQYFADNNPAREIYLLKNYPTSPSRGGSLWNALHLNDSGDDAWHKLLEATSEEEVENYKKEDESDIISGFDEPVVTILKDYGDRPRSYACEPFDLDREISGSVDFIDSLVPPEKKVRIVQWSGDTTPFEAAVRKTREKGLRNINGGDSRFDSEFPSYTSVAPIGLQVGGMKDGNGERQIYSSNSNENTYTKLWTDRFFGFRYLQTTVRNTETPRRVGPFNIYFHMYSGEKAASLGALKENLNFARTQEVIPIFASEYAAIADGFYSTEIYPLAPNRWQIKNRDGLQTIRFDEATLKSVNFEESKGVIGQRYLQGNLYVALNPTVKEPIISIQSFDKPGGYPISKLPYLISSRWQILDLINKKDSLIITARGFGRGQMLWKMPVPGRYNISIATKQNTNKIENKQTDKEGLLSLDIEPAMNDQIIIKIEKNKELMP